MGAFNQRVLGMTTTAVIVEFFSTEWIEINEYLNKWNKLSCNEKYALLVSTRWMMGLCQHCLCISLCMHREGDKGLNVSQLQELYFTWCAIEMQYLNLKTQARLLRGAFACKHQVVVWNTVLSEHFEALRTGRIDWDGSHFLLEMWVS